MDGIYQAGPASGRNASLDLMFFHYSYLNETRTLGQDSVDSYPCPGRRSFRRRQHR